MTERLARTKKVLILGVDGLDPRLTKKYVEEGLMPNTKTYIERGAQRNDLVMLGGHPTVTPPMWTTLATGAYSNVHGITGFYRKGRELDEIDYNLDSRLCKAEPLWNVTAESGLKTLVWHWPGCAWPPTSDSENLMVVDGSTPGTVGQASCTVDSEFILEASDQFEKTEFIPKEAFEATAACVIDDLEMAEPGKASGAFAHVADTSSNPRKTIMWKEEQNTALASEAPAEKVHSVIKAAEGWTNAPADAKEFTVLFSHGAVRRPALILKNDAGKYDKVAIYKNKKDTEPIVICPLGEMQRNVLDIAFVGDKNVPAIRSIKLLRISEDGNALTMYASMGMHTENDIAFYPKRLFQELKENVGTPVPFSFLGAQNDMYISECLIDTWRGSVDYQAASLLYLIEAEKLDVIFSHMHSVDMAEHQFIKHLADRPINRNPVSVAEKWMKELYIQTDYYLGQFLHLLDEGWTIFIVSDHAQVASAHDVPMLIDFNGLCTPVMEQMGYTVLKVDEQGNRIGEIDWTKTTAVLQREGHIYLNIKGRDKHTLEDGSVIDGLIDPADQYEMEEQIMTSLYNLKDPETGHRIVSVALRNRDAVLLGQGGPEAGDIVCWHAEGYNFDHADCLSTTYGEGDTSVSPIFIAAGEGLKKGFETDRIIRQVDFVATVAGLLGLRMPAQCEGAPVYPIFEKEF